MFDAIFRTRRVWAAWLLLIFGRTAVSAQDAGWELVWSDEFEGTSLDYSRWECEVNAFGGGNNELQIYTDRPKNVRVQDGHLIIEAHRDNAEINGTIREYSSGRIRSKHRGDWKYARVVVRARLPEGQGLWPAIWMLPTDNVYGTWARSGEIDIMEYKGQEPDTVWGTLHYGGRWPDNKHSGSTWKLPSGRFSEDFHEFALEWEEGVMRWYVDDRLIQTQSQWHSEDHAFPAPFDQRFYLVLNLAVGGQFLGNPNDTTPFPSQFVVDYARVYQRPPRNASR
jgi:beta-glucanase (GH16 family)